MKLRRSHPIAIYFYLYRFLYLLLIPLARGLVAILTGGFLQWLSGAWFDLLILTLILILAYEKWNHFKYYMDEYGIKYTIGIFYQQKIYIPLRRICTLSTRQPLWMRPLGICILRVDTIALQSNKADLSIYLNVKEADRIMALRRRPPEYREDAGRAESRPRTRDIVFLSIFTSNSFIGIVFVAAFISQAGQILGQDLYNLLMGLLRQIAAGLEHLSALLTLAFRLPPIAAGIAWVLIGGWLVAFLLTLLETQDLRTVRTKDTLQITGGILSRKEYSVLLHDISFIDIRQSLVMRVFRLYTVFVNAIGMGKENSDIRAIIPFSTRSRRDIQLHLLVPEYKESSRAIYPNPGAIMKFLIDPFWPCLLTPVGTVFLMWLLPGWAPFFKFAGLMLCFPAYWFLGVRILDFISSGISCEQEYFTLRYSSGYYLHTVIFPWEQIALINMRQSILQRGDQKCDVKISTRSESGNIHHIRNVSWDGTANLFRAEDGYRLPPSLWDKCIAFFQKLTARLLKLK